MKRALIVLLVCVLCLSSSACGSTPEPSVANANFTGANCNNSCKFSCDFWAFDGSLFYMQDGFYNMGVYWSIDGNSTKLFEEADLSNELAVNSGLGDIFVSGCYLYFDVFTSNENWLYRYDLNKRSYSSVCEIPSLQRWVISDEYFIYSEHPSNNEEKRSPLQIYSLTDETTTEICRDVAEFGIIDGQLRYITNAAPYELYQYNYAEKRSVLLGAFDCKFDDGYNVFNFTSDAVVMYNWGEGCDRSLVVYTLSSAETQVYTLPKGIQDMVAADRYAYALLYDTQTHSYEAVPSDANGIYRISLDDGSYEIIEHDIDSVTNIHVATDDCLYMIRGKYNAVFLYSSHVYRYDHSTGTTEKLAEF